MSEFIAVGASSRRRQLATHAVPFADFRVFLQECGRPVLPCIRRATTGNPAVIGASQLEAAAYCEWLGSRQGRAYRLPSTEELDALMSQGPEHDLDAGIWPHEQGHVPQLIGGLKPMWLCEWTRETEERPGNGNRAPRVLASIFYPPWMREGSNIAHMHASLLASEGYSFVTFRVSYEG